MFEGKKNWKRRTWERSKLHQLLMTAMLRVLPLLRNWKCQIKEYSDCLFGLNGKVFAILRENREMFSNKFEYETSVFFLFK